MTHPHGTRPSDPSLITIVMSRIKVAVDRATAGEERDAAALQRQEEDAAAAKLAEEQEEAGEGEGQQDGEEEVALDCLRFFRFLNYKAKRYVH